MTHRHLPPPAHALAAHALAAHALAAHALAARTLVAFTLALALPALPTARAQTPAASPAAAPAPADRAGTSARLVDVQGEVTLDGAPAAVGTPVGAGTLATGADARAQVQLADGAVLALLPASRVRLDAGGERRLALLAGGLRLASAGKDWQVELPGRLLRASGMLHLVQCAAGCGAAPGLYGSTAAGEAVLEYAGGRSVLRNRHFRWAEASLRPEVLVSQPAPLAQAGRLQAELDAARKVRAEAGNTLKAAIEAFRDGDDIRAEAQFQQVRQALPGESLVAYYLGLIALKRQDNDAALAHLQLYAREDPEGAQARDVTKTLTLLSSAALQQEVASALSREKEMSAAPPEPNSIAVQAFVNRGDEQFRAMAKGLAAMVIADLAKVPGLNVLEREKVQLMRDEMKLGDSGLADPASAVRSGRLMRAEKVIIGNFEVQ